MKPEHLQLLLTREMPYGKYKGRKLADLPGHYLGWFAREGFPRGELGELLALMYELDHNALRGLLDPLRRRAHGGHGIWRQASSSTQLPISKIGPVSSASGMKSLGEIMPRAGWRQRISASAPTMRPLRSLTLGW